jgi:hypothetical protein|tara:strand:+ start:174 stop:350 length:177 start_codon:yes stop_codon:yes gene_type:complete
MLIDELRERILQEYDVDLLCEVLDISAEDILDAFENRVINKLEVFEELAIEEEDEDVY